jgi:hypothetical protein
MKNANLLFALGSAVFFAGAVHAQTTPGNSKPPLAQAAESVGKNLARDPDNRGLQNASKRIADNIADKQARMDAHDAHTSFERPMRVDRPDRGR